MVNEANNISLSTPRGITHTDDKREYEDQNILFIITHNPRDHNILQSVKHLPILHQSLCIRQIIQEQQIRKTSKATTKH